MTTKYKAFEKAPIDFQHRSRKFLKLSLAWSNFKKYRNAMGLTYRKQTKSLDSEWHFSEKCERWPQTDYQEVGFMDPSTGERVCHDCARLELTLIEHAED